MYMVLVLMWYCWLVFFIGYLVLCVKIFDIWFLWEGDKCCVIIKEVLIDLGRLLIRLISVLMFFVEEFMLMINGVMLVFLLFDIGKEFILYFVLF